MENTVHTRYAKRSFVLAVAPVAALLSIFLFCLIGSGGGVSDNDAGAIWWIFVASLWVLTPAIPFAAIASVVCGIKALKTEKALLAYLGISISLLELSAVFGYMLLIFT